MESQGSHSCKKWKEEDKIKLNRPSRDMKRADKMSIYKKYIDEVKLRQAVGYREDDDFNSRHFWEQNVKLPLLSRRSSDLKTYLVGMSLKS